MTGKHRRPSTRVQRGKVPPNDEIAAYGTEHITCRNCGAKPGFACVEQAELWRTVCKEWFADAAAIYVPIWKKAQREGQDGEGA